MNCNFLMRKRLHIKITLLYEKKYSPKKKYLNFATVIIANR